MDRSPIELPMYGDWVLGHVAPKKPRFSVTTQEVLPTSEWRQFDITTKPHPIEVDDQDGKGACNGHAGSKSAEWARWIAGQIHVHLSPWFIYAILCNGIDRGSNIGDALDLLMKAGTCRFESLAYATINPRRITDANRQEAVNYRIDVGGMLPSFDHIMTAVQLKRPGNFSLRVGGNFDPGPDGVVGFSRGPGNHAITFVPATKKLPNGEWAIKFQNSWGKRWGQAGFGWFTRRHIDDQSYFEAYDVQVPTDASDDDTNVPAPSV